MIFGVGGVFRPGFLTPGMAEELNRMRAALAALDRLGTVPPLTVTRLANGQPVIGMGGSPAGSFWAEVTAEGGGPTAYSWKKVELAPSGLFGDADPEVTGELNAYSVAGSAAVGDRARLFPSPTKPGSFEFLPGGGDGGFAIGKLDAQLSFGGSATMSVWEWDGAAYADTGDDLTVFDWLLSSGQTVASGKQVAAQYDARSDRWFVTGSQCS